MNKQEQLNSDKKVLASLKAAYKRVRCQTDSVRACVTDLNFEDNVPDKEEQWLMKEQLSVYEQVQNNLMNRIRFYRDRVKSLEQVETTIAEEDKCKPTFAEFDDLLHRAVDKLKELIVGVDEPECNQLVSKLKDFYALRYDIKEILIIDPHHCGHDADMDDACCQAREKRPVGDDSAVVEDPIITGDSLKELVGWQIVSVMPPKWKCQGCGYDSEEFRCEKKVELVGGYYLCLAPLPNSIITE